MQYNKVTETQIKTFQQIVGLPFVIILDEDKAEYAQDYTEDLYYMPEVVVKPKTTDEVAAIVKVCYENNLPITPRGAGTGLSGGALPIYGGVVIAMGRMDQIIDIDERNFQVTVEPGVINENLQQAVKEKGLFYPPDPASKGSCFLGGNIAHASGGPRALKYGTTRDYVLNLEVVLPTGEVIWTGANTLKYSTGYNLTHLFIGSEGTLGIVTKMVLKLIPHPQQTLLMLAPFSSPEKACEAVNGIFIADPKVIVTFLFLQNFFFDILTISEDKYNPNIFKFFFETSCSIRIPVPDPTSRIEEFLLKFIKLAIFLFE